MKETPYGGYAILLPEASNAQFEGASYPEIGKNYLKSENMFCIKDAKWIDNGVKIWYTMNAEPQCHGFVSNTGIFIYVI